LHRKSDQASRLADLAISIDDPRVRRNTPARNMDVSSVRRAAIV
jgi:hypothetical protein